MFNEFRDSGDFPGQPDVARRFQQFILVSRLQVDRYVSVLLYFFKYWQSLY